jgi:hypothetical protein
MTSNIFEIRAVYEKLWEHFVEGGRPQITWRMRIAFWIPQATNTLRIYIIFTAFPLQQWWQECTQCWVLFLISTNAST